MLKRLQVFMVGVLVACLLLTNYSVFAESITKTITVVLNKTTVKTNGKPIKIDNLLYNGTPYAPIKAVAEMLGKEVKWDGKTNTINISDKKSNLSDSVIFSSSKMSTSKTLIVFKYLSKKYKTQSGLGYIELYRNEKGTYYCSLLGIKYLLNLSLNNFQIVSRTETLPTYYDGQIQIINNVFVAENGLVRTEVIPSDNPRGAPKENTIIYNYDKSKSIKVSNDQVVGFNIVVPLFDILDKLGINYKCENDKVNDLLILEFPDIQNMCLDIGKTYEDENIKIVVNKLDLCETANLINITSDILYNYTAIGSGSIVYKNSKFSRNSAMTLISNINNSSLEIYTGTKELKIKVESYQVGKQYDISFSPVLGFVGSSSKGKFKVLELYYQYGNRTIKFLVNP
jgi:hypothetical protein